MHQHIEWDEPGSASVMQYFKKHPDQSSQPDPGDIISARYQGAMVRVKVEAYREDDAVSIGEVAAIIDTDGSRHQSHNKQSGAVRDTALTAFNRRSLARQPIQLALESQ